MDDIIGRIEDERGLLQRIGARLPGFRGYQARETRREADKILRDRIASQFEAQARRLPQLQMDLINSAKLEHVDDIERASMKLKLFIDRLKTTPRGYAGFFDAIKVNEDELEQLYYWDMRLLDEVDKFAAAVDRVAEAIGSGQEIGIAVRDLIAAASAVNELYTEREHVLLGSV